MPDKTVSFAEIKPTNPLRKVYEKTIAFWNSEWKEKINSREDKTFYAIYFGEEFLGLSTIELIKFDKEGSMANVEILNASINESSRIDKESTDLLSEMINNKYGTNDIVFSYVKRK